MKQVSIRIDEALAVRMRAGRSKFCDEITYLIFVKPEFQMRYAVRSTAKIPSAFGMMIPSKNPDHLVPSTEKGSIPVMRDHFETQEISIKPTLAIEIVGN